MLTRSFNDAILEWSDALRRATTFGRVGCSVKYDNAQAAAKWLPQVLRFFSAIVTLAVFCMMANRVLATESPSPGPVASGVVESFHAVLIECMKRSDELGFAGRYQLIMDSQGETFDIPTVARTSILRGWKRLGTEDRSRWVALARRYWASRYAYEYRRFSGHRFETLGVDRAADGNLMVHTKLTQSDGDDLKLDYRMRKIDEVWRIVDIQVPGQRSEIRNLREFNYAVLERRSFEDLVEAIGQEIERFQRE